MKSRYWQKVRGICILAVILIHCPAGESGSSLYIWMISRYIINFAVAMFIFMSGYFVNPEKVKKGNYIGGRIQRLLIPFLIWDSFYAIKNILLNHEYSTKRFIVEFVTGKTAAPLYYILVLIQLTILTPYIVKTRYENRGKWLYMVTPVYLLILYGYIITTGKQPFLYETVFPAWLLFYLLGIDLKRGVGDKLISKVRISWVGGALGISLIESFLLMKIGTPIGFLSSQIRFGNFVYAFIFIAWIKKRECDVPDDVLNKVGDCSFGMYFIHLFVLQVVQKIICLLGLNQIWILYWGCCFFLTTIISYYCVNITRKVISDKNVLKLVGFD